jgi:hypothetical protein
MTPSPSSQDRLKGQIGCTIHDYKNGVIDADVAVNAILELTRPTPNLGDVDELLKALELARNEIVGSLELLRGLRSARNIEWGEDGRSALNARIASCEATLVKTTDTIIALRAALDKKD